MSQDTAAGTQSRVDLKVGGSTEPGEGAPIAVYDPSTEGVIGEVRAASAQQVGRAVSAARAAMDSGELGTAEERSSYLHRLADVMTAHADEILELAVAEVGTPISTARDLHLNAPLEILRWTADAALVDRTEYRGRNEGPSSTETIVHHRPVGVVAGIAAYNYPHMFHVMKAGSALAAGCSIVLLSSPLAPLSSLQFADFLDEAGVPARAVSVLAGGVETAQALIGTPQVAKVSFTGSVVAGTAVMKAAAEGIRDVVLELGGKSAAILLPSVDVAAVAKPIHYRYLRNAGQGCASPTRILVHESRLEEFLEASRAVYDAVPVGDPRDPETIVGPVISPQHGDRVRDYIAGALADGGRALATGHLPMAERGWYVQPTLIGGLGNDARLNQEEVFGPVASVQTYRTVDEAVAIANASTYGLHASVYGSVEEAKAIAPRLEVGLVTINGAGRTRPDVPNGGWKQSGIGRERGEEGVREFLEPVAVQWPAGTS